MSRNENKKMTTCTACGNEIAKSAKKCPHCGAKVKKPIFKKWWFWLIVVALIGSVVSGGGSETGKNDITGSSGSQSEAITIEEQVLFEHSGVKVSAVGYLEDALWGDGIQLLIENSGDKSIGVGCKALIVNDYMIADLFTATVAANKKSNEVLYLSSSALEAAGISNVGQIEVYFYLYNSDTYDTIYNADKITIKTSAYETMDSTPNDLGVELYNKGGVKIVGKYVDEDSFWGAAVLLYIENNSGKNINVTCDDLSVNGFMIDSIFYANVYDGKKSIDDITLFSTDLEESNIESIDEIECVFKIINADTYSTISTTDPITFTTK